MPALIEWLGSLIMSVPSEVFGWLITSALGAVALYAHRSEALRSLFDRAVSFLIPARLGEGRDARALPRIRSRILRKLSFDQSLIGRHAGEFGRGSDRGYEGAFNLRKSKEAMAVKPRVYLTLWPVHVLAKHHLLRGHRASAVRGIRHLLHDDRVYEHQSAGVATPPTDLEPEPMISYRHTISCALLLYYAEGMSSTVRDVASAMIAAGSQWQNEDGGWANCDRHPFTDSDMWGSAYALRFLTELNAHAQLSDEERSASIAAISKTIAYFRRLWDAQKWAFGKVTAEENAVLTLIELAPALMRYDQEFFNQVLEKVSSWVTPFGKLSEHHSTRLAHRSPLSRYARMAYALRISGASSDRWRPLYQYAVEMLPRDSAFKPKGRATSADLSFLLDLVCEDIAFVKPAPERAPTPTPRVAAAG